MKQSGDLAGKVAVVTGAGRGLGRAAACAFAAAGASVVIVSRTERELAFMTEKGDASHETGCLGSYS